MKRLAPAWFASTLEPRRLLAGAPVLTGCCLALLTPSCVPNEGREDTSGRAAAEGSGKPNCQLHGRVNKDATFYKACSPYIYPPGGIDVIDGATLTIEAGVEIRFNDRDWLEVGAAGKPGRLIAKGTPEEPIVLTTRSPETPSTWFGIWFHSGTLPGSELSHAVVRSAGGHNRHSKPNLLMGCVTLTGVKPGALTLRDVHVEDCGYGGFRISNSDATLSGLSVSDATEGIIVDAASAGFLPGGVRHDGVTRDVITGGNVAANARWLPQPVPLVVAGDITVQGPGGPTLRLEPGLELQFEGAHALRVGEREPGALLAEGTAEAPIVLRAHDENAPWGGVSLLGKASPASRLRFVEIRDTAPEAAVTLRTEAAGVALEHVKFANNAADVLVGCGSKPTLADNQHGPGAVRHESPCAAPAAAAAPGR